MTDRIGRGIKVYSEFCDGIVASASRTLHAADAQAGHARPWWAGNVHASNNAVWNLRVGGIFDLQEDAYGQNRVAYYRVVALAQAPEGYISVVAYAGLNDDDMPKNGAPIPVIHFGMLVK